MAAPSPATRTRRTMLASGGMGIAAFVLPWTTGLTIAVIALATLLAVGALAITAAVLFSRRNAPCQRLQQLLACLRRHFTGEKVRDVTPTGQPPDTATGASDHTPDTPEAPEHPNE